MQTERGLALWGEPEAAGLIAFPLGVLPLSGPQERDGVKEPQLRVLGRVGEHRLDLDPSGRPIPEFDQRRHEMGAHL